MTIKIQLGKFSKEIEEPSDLATCLEFALTWGEAADNNVGLLRVCSAALGVALDKEALLPKYRPDRDKIYPYGRKILSRLLEQGVSSQEIFTSGSVVLSAMAAAIPNKKEVEEKEDFFLSPEEED